MDRRLSQPTPQDAAEYETVIAFYRGETQKILDQMQHDQVEIDRIKEDTRLLHAEIFTIKTETRAILDRLKMAALVTAPCHDTSGSTEPITVRAGETELGRQSREVYERLRPQVETPENIGKMLVLDAASGDYEIDDLGIETSLRLQARHPGSVLYAFRIGYRTAVSFAGPLERSAPL